MSWNGKKMAILNTNQPLLLTSLLCSISDRIASAIMRFGSSIRGAGGVGV